MKSTHIFQMRLIKFRLVLMLIIEQKPYEVGFDCYSFEKKKKKSLPVPKHAYSNEIW